MGIPDHLTSLLRNLYADQEATVRTGNGTTDWLQIGKGVHQAVYLKSGKRLPQLQEDHSWDCFSVWFLPFSPKVCTSVSQVLELLNRSPFLSCSLTFSFFLAVWWVPLWNSGLCWVGVLIAKGKLCWTSLRDSCCRVGVVSLASGQEYWSGLPFPPPGYLPTPGIKSVSCIAWILCYWASWEAHFVVQQKLIL